MADEMCPENPTRRAEDCVNAQYIRRLHRLQNAKTGFEMLFYWLIISTCVAALLTMHMLYVASRDGADSNIRMEKQMDEQTQALREIRDAVHQEGAKLRGAHLAH